MSVLQLLPTLVYCTLNAASADHIRAFRSALQLRYLPTLCKDAGVLDCRGPCGEQILQISQSSGK